MSVSSIKFNINENVNVRLTPYGRIILNKAFPDWYTPYPEDSEGWTTFQLWKLMAMFGPHTRMGGLNECFETEIEILCPSSTPKLST